MGSIDFVITWVDGSDPEWQIRKNALSGSLSTDDREERYRDWGLLPYWFRGAEKYAPWVRKIWFVCDQEPPEWLNTDHSKLEIVRHEDYLPDEYRPAFSANPIELNLHRIKGLSEKFVYFNDDTFLIKNVRESFFFKDELPCDCALLNTIPTDDLAKDPNGRIFTFFLNNASYINRDYNFRECLKKNLFKWVHPCYGKDLLRNIVLCSWPRFVGSVEPHLPQAFLKSSFEEAWKQDFDILDQTSRHHLRDDTDVNQWFIRLRQIMEGNFSVRKPIKGAVYTIGKNDLLMCEDLRKQKHPMVCINDTSMSHENFLISKEKLHEAFTELLPDISTFEK